MSKLLLALMLYASTSVASVSYEFEVCRYAVIKMQNSTVEIYCPGVEYPRFVVNNCSNSRLENLYVLTIVLTPKELEEARRFDFDRRHGPLMLTDRSEDRIADILDAVSYPSILRVTCQ